MGRIINTKSVSAATFVFFLLVLLLVIFFHNKNDGNKPQFSVIDTSVRSFNLSSDGHLLLILNMVFNIHNPDRKDIKNYTPLEVSVRKGKHHPIADDVVWVTSQTPLSSTLLRSEAVAVYQQLGKKIAGELRDDLAKGAGSVMNVFLSGRVGSEYIDVTCNNVVVQLISSKSMAKFSKVDCRVNVYDPDSG